MAAVDLGELGTHHDPVDMAFRWHGSAIRVNPDYSDLDFIEFLDEAASVDAADTVGAQRATMAFLRSQVHPEDWDRFRVLNRAHHQQFKDLMELAAAIVVWHTRFPTGQRSGSPPGPVSTEARSPDAYSSAVTASMRELKGRPDLKMFIWAAHQERERARQPG